MSVRKVLGMGTTVLKCDAKEVVEILGRPEFSPSKRIYKYVTSHLRTLLKS